MLPSVYNMVDVHMNLQQLWLPAQDHACIKFQESQSQDYHDPTSSVEVLLLKQQESLFFGGWQLAVRSLPMSQWMTLYHVHMGRTNGTHRVNFLKKKRNLEADVLRDGFVL